jgi:hypothetical protein
MEAEISRTGIPPEGYEKRTLSVVEPPNADYP